MAQGQAATPPPRHSPRPPHSCTAPFRAALAKASKAWSENQPLTQEQRDDWHAAAAKVKCRGRLVALGFRSGQQHFVGSNSLKERWGLPLLLAPPTGGRMTAEGRGQNTEIAPEPAQLQGLNPTSSDRPRADTGPLPDRHGVCKGHTGRPSGLRVPIQVVPCQSLTRPASERPRPLALPPPVHSVSPEGGGADHRSAGGERDVVFWGTPPGGLSRMRLTDRESQSHGRHTGHSRDPGIHIDGE
jgi:hypothetical protein